MKIELNSEKISSRVLYIITGVIVLVFALFWLIGYDRPYDEDPNFNAPLFTNLLLVTMMLLFVGTVAVAAWSIVRSFKIVGKGDRYSNNIPVKKIGYIVGCGTFVVMLFTFLIGSSTPIKINGSPYNDVFWLKVTDMFVSTSLLMIVAAIGAVIYGSTRYNRKS